MAGGLTATDEVCKVPGHYLTVHQGGRLVKVKVRRAVGARVAGGATRGRVRTFSPAARKRLLDAVASIDGRAVDPRRWLFVTLTYPSDWPGDPEVWKAHLAAWWKRFCRAAGSAWGCFWKLEPQLRGAPHFHLIMIPPRKFVYGVKSFRKWLSRSWYQVVGSGDEKHLRAGTQAKRVQSFRGAVAYAAKYAAKCCAFADKETGEALPVGRLWGIMGRDNIPFIRTTVLMTAKGCAVLRRLMVRLWSRLPRGLADNGFSVYVDWATARQVLGYLIGEGLTVGLDPFTEGRT